MLTKEHENNLIKLAEYLKRPKLMAEFDMSLYSTDGESSRETTCGTVGCAIGHGPYATGIHKMPDEGWTDYCERIFGVDWTKSEFRFLFNGLWAQAGKSLAGQGNEVSCTAYQVACRIEHFIEHGIPAEWDYQSIY